jgi:hypothetical protein
MRRAFSSSMSCSDCSFWIRRVWSSLICSYFRQVISSKPYSRLVRLSCLKYSSTPALKLASEACAAMAWYLLVVTGPNSSQLLPSPASRQQCLFFLNYLQN